MAGNYGGVVTPEGLVGSLFGAWDKDVLGEHVFLGKKEGLGALLRIGGNWGSGSPKPLEAVDYASLGFFSHVVLVIDDGVAQAKPHVFFDPDFGPNR
jgi:hypothetical protein